jgi:hypothetical protein
MTIPVTCPDCGFVAEFDTIQRSAEEFCPKCDYPLFWVKTDAPTVGGTESIDSTRRRLPGAGGRVTVGSRSCPSCAELNRLSATTCIRCGSLLDPPAPAPLEIVPAPTVVPEEVVEVAPPPEPRRKRWWLRILVATLLAAGIVVLIVLVV